MSSNIASRKVPLLCAGHSRPVPELSYSRKQNSGHFYLISSCLDGKPMLRDGVTGDWIGSFIGHKGAVWCSRLNSTAHQSVTASADYTAKLWSSVNGDVLHTFPQKKLAKAVDFSTDDAKIIVGGAEKVLNIYDLQRPDVIASSLVGHTDSIKVVLWNPNSVNEIMSSGADSMLRLWDIRSGAVIQSVVMSQPISNVEYTVTTKYITTTCGRDVDFRDPQTLQTVRSHKVTYDINTASLHPQQRYFVTGGADFWVRIHDFETGKELELHRGHHGPVHCIRFAPDGETFASGSEDGTIRLWLTDNKDYGNWRLSKENAEKGPEERVPSDGAPS